MVPTQIRIYFCGCKKSQHVILEIRESPILKLLSKNWKHPSCHGGSSTSLMRLYLTSCAFAYCYIIFFVRAIPWSVMNCKKNMNCSTEKIWFETGFRRRFTSTGSGLAQRERITSKNSFQIQKHRPPQTTLKNSSCSCTRRTKNSKKYELRKWKLQKITTNT